MFIVFCWVTFPPVADCQDKVSVEHMKSVLDEELKDRSWWAIEIMEIYGAPPLSPSNATPSFGNKANHHHPLVIPREGLSSWGEWH